MKALLRALFGATPKIGQIYLIDLEDPFLDPFEVEIKAVKSGWVLFTYLYNGMDGRLGSMSASSFRFTYKLKQAEPSK
jgi:hypothetical protein